MSDTVERPCCCESLRVRDGRYAERCCTACAYGRHTGCTFHTSDLSAPPSRLQS